MEEFNSDNEKIEAALLGKVPMTVLHDETLAENQNQIQFDIVAEGWGDHKLVLLTYVPPKNAGSTWLTVSLGASTSKKHVMLGSGNNEQREGLASIVGNYRSTMLITPATRNDYLQILALGAGYTCLGGDNVGSNPQPLTIRAGGPYIYAGTRVTAISIL